ncbi:MAG: flippase [Proteobacteria bacterium]|nr:flippase [Pseudomonadota bacterium]MCP4922221.1 flippase [Pseudomonadota bacterium]
MSEEPKPSDGATEKAAEVAAGSGLVFVGNLLNRGLRFLTNWILANALGPLGYGVYEGARNFVTILSSFAPLGTDKGVVYFGARQRQADDRPALRGTLIATLVTSLIGGPVLMGLVITLVMAGQAEQAWALALLEPIGALEPGVPEALLLMSPAIAIWSLLLGCVGILRGLKDMRGQTLAYLVVLPIGMAMAAAIPWALGLGVQAVIVGFVAANAASLVVALALVVRRVKPLIAGVKAKFDASKLFAYSLPESFSSMLFRVNQWADTMMVLALAGTAETGLYRTAVTLAMIGEVPAVAVNTMFQPVLAEMVQAGDPIQIKKVLRIVTRWMVILAAPVYIGVYVGIDVLLALWKDEFASAGSALTILLWGQAAYVLTVPVNALIPMSGRARLNLVNAGLAALLNIGLNLWMIPQWGIQGAATATGISLAAWSLWRLVQVRFLLGHQGFEPRALMLVVVFAAVALAGRWFGVDQTLLIQAGVTVVSILVFLAVAAVWGRSPEDDLVLAGVKRRISKKLGRAST